MESLIFITILGVVLVVTLAVLVDGYSALTFEIKKLKTQQEVDRRWAVRNLDSRDVYKVVYPTPRTSSSPESTVTIKQVLDVLVEREGLVFEYKPKTPEIPPSVTISSRIDHVR